MKIELRQDGWFDAGKDSDNSIVRQIYEEKQALKQKISQLNKRGLNRSALSDALSEISMTGEFKRAPYLRGDEVLVDVHGMPGTCFLGTVTE